MADQLRHDWLGAAGTPGVATPAIDAVIERGRWFTQACTDAAICVPARLALATGLSPERTGALGNEAVLAPGARTHYQQLRDHGYRVGVVGKLDLAKSAIDNGAGDRPEVFRWGFTHPLEVEGKMHAGGMRTGRPLGPYGRWLADRGLFDRFSEDYVGRLRHVGGPHGSADRPAPPYDGDDLYRVSALPAEAHADRYVGDRAVEWLAGIGDDHPWHLFVSFPGPHDPFDPPDAWARRFADAPVPEAIPAAAGAEAARRPGHVAASRWRLSDAPVATVRRRYSAATALIDAQIGAILDAVERRGFARETVVVIASDHGEMLGDHGLFQKSVAYDPAMRVPLVIAGPGIEPGRSDALVALSDLGPTLVELAGIEPLAGLDARSVAPVLRGERRDHRRVVVCSEHHYVAIRSATDKYVHNTGAHARAREAEVDECYDLVADPGERVNRFGADPAAAAAARDTLLAAARADGQDLHRVAPRD